MRTGRSGGLLLAALLGLAFPGLARGAAIAAAPTYSPAPGAFPGPVTVPLSSRTAGAAFYYTTDGSTPSRTRSPVYTGTQADLLAELDGALTAFDAAMTELGVADSVTAFTASDFGRTLIANGDGSDHGWGNHHFVVGGAVRGGRIYGQLPTLAVGGPNDAGDGRWIPTTSVDEYAATLARWFGVAGSDLPMVLPNLGRFAHPDLGFLG